MSLLKETFTNTAAKLHIEESASETQPDGKKKLFLVGICMEAEKRNLNGRIYPLSELRHGIEMANEQIRDLSFYSEIDHPSELSINIDKICGIIRSISLDGNNGIGKIEIVPTPSGNIIRTLIESGARLGVSTRGSGNVDSTTGRVSDFELMAIDVVARPSAENALPRPIYETRESRRGHIIEDLARAVSHDPKAQKHLHKELLEWIDKLK
jgi:hypothetical protein